MLIAAALAVLCYIAGMMQGYYARTIADKVKRMYALHRERIETPAGVVRPTITRGATRAQSEPIDLTADDEDAGISLRPSAKEIRLQNMEEREKRVRSL